ncbi:MAG: hypothetical protein ACYCVD_18200 [Desulfitobacteriaceae bacterium]
MPVKVANALTAVRQVNLIVTDMGVMEVTPKGLVLRELAPGLTFEEVQAATEARLIPNLFYSEIRELLL